MTSRVRPAPLACLECRRSHLKCDGRTPVCERCRSRNYVCTYTKSERGRRRGTARARAIVSSTTFQIDEHSADGATSSDEVQAQTANSERAEIQHIESDSSASNAHTVFQAADEALLPTPLSHGSNDGSIAETITQIDDEQLVNLYYLNFHPSHPILLPRSMYWKQNYPTYIQSVVHLIGGYFALDAPRETLRTTAASALRDAEPNRAEKVQACILYTIFLLGQDDIIEGGKILDTTIEAALRLGMHREDFASSYANNETTLEESMRRTWWELYTTDGCVAALQRRSTFRTNVVNADVLLPCDDFIYESGMCYMPSTLQEFHKNVFLEEEKVFSSFSYRIEAVRLLGRVLTVTSAHAIHRDAIQAIDNALTAFIHNLPRSKSEPEIANTFGELDELMFQAHTLIQYSIMLLHFPRCDIISSSSTTQGVLGGNCTKVLCPCNRQHVHSIKAIEASRSISMLASLHCPVQRHSPFWIYPLALAAAVQVSTGAAHARGFSYCLEQHSDRVKLILGVMKSLSKYWAASESTRQTLKRLSYNVFQNSCTSMTPPSQEDARNEHTMGACPQIPINGDWLENFDLQNLGGLVGF